MSIARGSIQHKIYEDIISFITSILNRKSCNQVEPNKRKIIESEISSYFYNHKITLFPYARTSLYAALKNLNLQKGSTILCTPINISPMVNIIEHLGYKIEFIDLNLIDFGPDYKNLETKLSESPSCFFLTYLFGYVPNMKLIVELCNKFNIPLIEDISQNIGSKYDSKLLGTFGKLAIYSASMTKYIDGYNGAFTITNDQVINEGLKNFATGLRKPDSYRIKNIILKTLIWNIALNKHIFSILTYNILYILSRLSPRIFDKLLGPSIITKRNLSLPKYYFENITNIQALNISKNLSKLNKLINERRNFARLLLRSIQELIPFEHKINHPSKPSNFLTFWQFVLEVKDIKLAREILFENGIETSTTNLPNLAYNYGIKLPNTHRIKSSFIFIPMHNHLNINHYRKTILLLKSQDLLVIDINFLQRMSSIQSSLNDKN